MDSSKFEIRVLTTPEEIEMAGLHYFQTAAKQNPFMSALGIDLIHVYQATLQPRLKMLAEQELSIGIFNKETGELIAEQLTTDAMSDFHLESEFMIIRAQDAFFLEGKKRILEEMDHEVQYGEMIEVLVMSVSPEYEKLHLSKLMCLLQVKNHMKKGYKWHYGENVNPSSQNLLESLNAQYMVLRLFYNDYEFEGEKVFEKMHFGDGYKNERPCCMFFVISLEGYLKSIIDIFNRIKVSKGALVTQKARL